MHTIEIEINNEKYLLDFNSNKLFDKNKFRVKPEIDLLRLYIIQENIKWPKSNNNQGLIGAIKKHFKDLLKYDNLNQSIPKPLSIQLNSADSQIHDIEYILIPCSKSKIPIEEMQDRKFIISDLSFDSILREERLKLLDLLNDRQNNQTRNNVKKKKYEVVQNDIDFNKSERASKVYSRGILYNSAKSLSWTSGQSKNIFILSALFGIISANDYIPLYDFAITDRINEKNKFATEFWKKNKKLNSVLDELNERGIKLLNLLSSDYNKVIDIHNNLVDPQITSGDKWGYYKGKWIFNKLTSTKL